jgi:hypothetical protein
MKNKITLIEITENTTQLRLYLFDEHTEDIQFGEDVRLLVGWVDLHQSCAS